MGVDRADYDENFAFSPNTFLDYIHDVNNTSNGQITAAVPTAAEIFYHRPTTNRGHFVLRKPEYEFTTDARIIIRNLSTEPNARVLLDKPEGHEEQIIFRNFLNLMLPRTAYYLHVQSDHVKAKDKDKAILEFYLIAHLTVND